MVAPQVLGGHRFSSADDRSRGPSLGDGPSAQARRHCDACGPVRGGSASFGRPPAGRPPVGRGLVGQEGDGALETPNELSGAAHQGLSGRQTSPRAADIDALGSARQEPPGAFYVHGHQRPSAPGRHPGGSCVVRLTPTVGATPAFREDQKVPAGRQ